jgi:hypothetical protein
MKKLIISGVLALSVLTSCAGKHNSTAGTAQAESQLPPYSAGIGSPYIQFPDFEGFHITDPFSYEAGKPDISGSSETLKSVTFYRDGKKICGELYLPEGSGPFPVVVVSSGQTASFSRYKDEAKNFAENGIACIISDYTGTVGNSRSDGELTESSVLTEAQDLNAILDSLPELPEIDENSVFLWGNSIGGLVSTIVAGERKDEIKGMVLLEPDFTYPDLTRYRNPDLSKVSDEINEPQYYNTLVGKQFIIDMCSVDALKEIDRYDKDVLIIFGNAGPDKAARPALSTLYPEAYETAVSTFRSCETVVIDGADHLFQGEYGRTAAEKSTDFIKSHLS